MVKFEDMLLKVPPEVGIHGRFFPSRRDLDAVFLHVLDREPTSRFVQIRFQLAISTCRVRVRRPRRWTSSNVCPAILTRDGAPLAMGFTLVVGCMRHRLVGHSTGIRTSVSRKTRSVEGGLRWPIVCAKSCKNGNATIAKDESV